MVGHSTKYMSFFNSLCIKTGKGLGKKWGNFYVSTHLLFTHFFYLLINDRCCIISYENGIDNGHKAVPFFIKKMVWLPILSSESVFRAVGRSKNLGGGGGGK